MTQAKRTCTHERPVTSTWSCARRTGPSIRETRKVEVCDQRQQANMIMVGGDDDLAKEARVLK